MALNTSCALGQKVNQPHRKLLVVVGSANKINWLNLSIRLSRDAIKRFFVFWLDFVKKILI